MPKLMRKPLPLAGLVLCLVSPSTSAQIGSVVHAQKLNEVSGGIVGPIARLGYSLAAIGDLNGDGVGDLVAGVPLDSTAGEEHGALLVLFLGPDGTVVGQQKISELVGGFATSLPDFGWFGMAVASPGDLDGDGLQEVVVRGLVPQMFWVLFLEADGSVRTFTKIPWSDPVFRGSTRPGDFTPHFDVPGLTAMGDLDGDGVGDLAIGAPNDDAGDQDAGAVWILYLTPDGTAKEAKKIAQGSGGFTGDLQRLSNFGYSLACLGDVNGDGFMDLSVSERSANRRWFLFLDSHQDVIGATTLAPAYEVWAPIGDLDGDGIAECASSFPYVWFLAADGHARKRLRISPGRNGMPLDPNHGGLGEYGFAPLGDLDGDGTLELAVGDSFDSETGGAIWILSLARTPVRNGSGTNPLVYQELAEPVLGKTWKAVLDCGGHARGMAALFGFERPLSGVFLPAGELLVDPSSRRFFQLFAPHSGGLATFSADVPPEVSLIDLQIYSQGASGGPPGVVLSNALYLLVGN